MSKDPSFFKRGKVKFRATLRCMDAEGKPVGKSKHVADFDDPLEAVRAARMTVNRYNEEETQAVVWWAQVVPGYLDMGMDPYNSKPFFNTGDVDPNTGANELAEWGTYAYLGDGNEEGEIRIPEAPPGG